MYGEIIREGNLHRERYKDGFARLVDRLNQEGSTARDAFMPVAGFARSIERHRLAYHKMLGLDRLTTEALPAPQLRAVGETAEAAIHRLTVFVTPELPMQALLFVPHGARKVPLVVAQHGGGGTPELCSDLHGKNNYNHMVERLLRRGAAVLAPQLLLWNFREETDTQRLHDIPYNRHRTDVELKRFGLSVTAVEIRGIMNAITYAQGLSFVDGDKIGMTGISYGGYYTLYTAAADPRIKSAYAMACFNDRNVYSWPDMCYGGSGNTFQDAEVAALCAPRALFVSLGKEDPVFDYRFATSEAERTKKYFAAMGCPDRFVFDLWEGGHTMRDDDLGLDFMFEFLQ